MARPARHNPFDAELRADLMTVLERVRNDPDIRVLVLTGSPGVFCAGGNLHVLLENVDAGSAGDRRDRRARHGRGLRACADQGGIERLARRRPANHVQPGGQ